VTATRHLSASRRQKSSAAHYVSLRLADGFAERVREVLAATLADEEHSVRLVKEHLTKRLAELEAKEHNLLDLLADGGAVAAKVRTRLLAISEQRERVNSELAEQGPLLEAGATLIETALDLLDAPQELYRQTTDPVRRQLNEVFFDRLYLDADDVVDDRLAEPFSDFLYPRSVNRRRVAHTRGARVGTQDGVTWDRRWGISAGASLLQRIAHGEGLSKAAMVELRMVELRGLEPLTSSMPWWPGVRKEPRCQR
jgi:site-specific DNA recombinase